MYLLRVDTATLVARYDAEFAFQVYAAFESGDGWTLLISRIVDETQKSDRYTPREVFFDLMEVKLGGENGGDDAPGKLEVMWTLRGKDVPYWACWSDGWLVLSETPFEEPSTKVETEEEKQERERKAKISKLGLGASLDDEGTTNVEATEVVETEAMDVDKDDTAYPFSWTQDASTITLSFPLEGVTKRDVTVALNQSSIGLGIKSTSLAPPLVAFLSKPERALWGDIKAGDSTWTLDSTGLEMTLTKVDENTRWPSVFAPSDDSDDEEDDVPETFTASTLASMRESFTTATRSDSEPQGPHPGIPALIREEMDFDMEDEAGDDVDAAGAVGRQVLVGHIVDGSPSWSRQAPSVLSLPLDKVSIIVKQAVDGLVFAPPTGDAAREPWRHEGTCPALAFVMSSKRDLRLVRHVNTGNKTTVFAFDSGSGTGNGNVYVYYPAADSGETAPQGVVGVSGRERGALLGVGSVDGVVVALCERVLVVLAGVM